MSPPDPALVRSLRDAIHGFLQARLADKLAALKAGDVESRARLQQDFLPTRWLGDAARRAGQIRQVTHALKFTHPDAKGSSLHAGGNPRAGRERIGTHTLAAGFAVDVVGNAAALDVFKFLRIEVAGQTLLARAVGSDPALLAALPAEEATARQWLDAFAAIARQPDSLSSHRLARQVYWPLGDGAYHLLAPLFPTSLAHAHWHTIREDRFGEPARAAREAARQKRPHTQGFREYRDLVVQKFGGTKPQNISQLNSERYGENYLLAAVPPLWNAPRPQAPLGIESIFDGRFGQRPLVRRLLRALRAFLQRVERVNNVRIRETRGELVAQICDELLNYAATLQALEPGWSRHADCRLNADEQCWFDPSRTLQDADFAALRRRGEWQDGVCRRFSLWLNARLETTRLPMDADTSAHWHSVLADELALIRTELQTDD